MRPVRVERTTNRLKAECSTTELRAPSTIKSHRSNLMTAVSRMMRYTVSLLEDQVIHLLDLAARKTDVTEKRTKESLHHIWCPTKPGSR